MKQPSFIKLPIKHFTLESFMISFKAEITFFALNVLYKEYKLGLKAAITPYYMSFFLNGTTLL
mgnify:CR=1 FL=1